jgi:predicted  nucleic acid-binding Zn-ribbon protein
MPHKCARCGIIYDDNAPELMNGCTCGARVFLFLRRIEGRSEEEIIEELRSQELEKSDIEWLDKKLGRKLEKEDKTVHLDVENLLRLGKGKYRLNVASLMKGEPLVFKVRDGVYYIDIPYSMRQKKTG